MTVFDFVDLCIEPSFMTVEIYSLDAGAVVWTGHGDDIPEEFLDCEVGSYDVPTKICGITLNID